MSPGHDPISSVMPNPIQNHPGTQLRSLMDASCVAIPGAFNGAIAYAVRLYKSIMLRDPGDETMQKLAKAIQLGARAFLHAEYKWLAVFVGAVFLLMLGNTAQFGWQMALPFLMGALFSAGAGYFGMHTATRAAVRTTQAAKTGLSQALEVAFQSGTVMGMVSTFECLASRSGQQSIEGLAGGISMALVTTETGLGIAIPALIILYYAQRELQETAL